MFKFKNKNKVKSIDKMSIVEILKNVKHCKATNNITNDDIKEYDKTFLLNPSNQSCFEYGWFTIEDFRDWAKGKGNIVKGDTPEQQAKFMEYDKLREELDYSLFSYFEYLDLLKDNGQMNPLCTLMSRSDAHFIDKTKSDDEIVRDILSSFVPAIVEQFEYMKIKDIKKEHQIMGWSIKKTLTLLDYTIIGACNVPCELYNIGWSWDLVFAKAYYLHLVKNKVKLPDIKFVHENRNTDKGKFK